MHINPVTAQDKELSDKIQNHGAPIPWNDPRIDRITRLRAISDPGYPVWDVTYCHGLLKDGTAVKIQVPFNTLPKKGTSKFIVEAAKKDGVYARGIGVLDNLSLFQ